VPEHQNDDKLKFISNLKFGSHPPKSFKDY